MQILMNALWKGKQLSAMSVPRAPTLLVDTIAHVEMDYMEMVFSVLVCVCVCVCVLENFMCLCLSVCLFHADIDECQSGEHNCHAHADCTNTKGGFMCRCQDGYYGDGVYCTGVAYSFIKLAVSYEDFISV